MKRIVCIGLLSLATVGMVYGQNNDNRDSVIINHPRRVTIVTTDKTQRIDVLGSEKDSTFRYSKSVMMNDKTQSVTREGSDWEFKLPFSKSSNNNCGKKGHHVEVLSGTFFFGFNSAPGAPDNMNVKMYSSWELGFSAIRTNWYPTRNNVSISLGLDLEWRNYRMTEDYQFAKGASNIITISKYPEGSDISFSRLKIFSLNVPLLFNHQIHKHVNYFIGPELEFNTHGSLKTRYKGITGNPEQVTGVKITDNNIHQTPVTYSFLGGISFFGINLFGKYSPCNILDTKYGPKFHSFTVGIFVGL
jgi:hypothetical protein